VQHPWQFAPLARQAKAGLRPELATRIEQAIDSERSSGWLPVSHLTSGIRGV
jgi:hypothetical protein